MLKESQLVYLADLVPNGPTHLILKCFLQRKMRQHGIWISIVVAEIMASFVSTLFIAKKRKEYHY